MTEYHTVYKDAEGTTTEWEDLQAKYGNLPQKEKPKAEPWAAAPEASTKDREWLDQKSASELEELEDGVEDDRFLEQYRRQRMEQLKEAAAKPRFGSLQFIRSSEYISEVSQAPPDVWVVVLLLKEGNEECALLRDRLQQVAEKYKGTKFVTMISTDCIKSYPDSNLPTVLVYNNKLVKATIVGLQKFGGHRCSMEDIEFALCQIGPVLDGGGASSEEQRGVIGDRIARSYMEKLLAEHGEKETADEES